MTSHDPATAGARADLCRFLAACYYEPAEEFSEERLFESMAAAAAQIDPELAAQARRLGEQFPAQGLEDLLVDYTRLFLGPNRSIARPYGSIWLSGEQALMQDSTMAVLELYREGGFELDEGFRELPDHIAAELEFLYLLIQRDPGSLRKRFLEEHLGRWVGPFTDAMHAGAETPFYRELAKLTGRLVALEASRAD